MTEINATISITKDQLRNNQIDIISLMMICGVSPGGATARRVIRLGAVSINGIQVTNETHAITEEMLQEGVVVQIGKKNFVKARLEV